MSSKLEADLASGALSEAIAAIAAEAAAVILPYWRSGVTVDSKSDDSPVTRADREAEAVILQRITAAWPGVQTVAEEAVAADGAPAHAEDWFWLIDPLDGTKGFISDGEAFTVNIALIHGREPVAGAVHAPATGIAWRTTTPGGAAVRREAGGDWTPIHVRPHPGSGTALLSHSVKGAAADELAALHRCQAWQGVDSSLKFCLIAEGGFDVYPRTGPTYEWDTAAGQAVLEAAGGRVLDAEGRRLAYAKPRFLNGTFVAYGG